MKQRWFSQDAYCTGEHHHRVGIENIELFKMYISSYSAGRFFYYFPSESLLRRLAPRELDGFCNIAGNDRE